MTMKWGWLAKPWIPMRFGMLSVIALFFLALVMMPVRDVYEEKSIGEE
ncbi:MAG: hypothetical protein JKX97_06870 [Candidatus Lindowbacteria bacterium]|nr:hypothetical protein [Candidatus Lindowbacteria bacterium]